jgi:hypothetical protein
MSVDGPERTDRADWPCPLFGVKLKSCFDAVGTVVDPFETWATLCSQ